MLIQNDHFGNHHNNLCNHIFIWCCILRKNNVAPISAITNKAPKVNRGSQKGLASAENLSQAITINHFI